ncbi:MAG: diacylglycerol kinase family lipid kinase [Bacteroidetes bacterium]|nr:MAG: diacylglycerol kinase family lipid kinase [Bacteroidota bacterium]
MKKKVRFIVNPFSGTNKKYRLSALIETLLDTEKYDWEIVFTEYAGHAVELARAAVERKYFMVVAVGGDGSVNEVAQALIHSETVLGILPSGSGNGFAMHLGIGRNLKKAFRFLNEGRTLTIDTCRMGDTPFVNLAGLGFDAEVAARIKGRKLRGFWGYLVYSLQEAFSYRMMDFEITLNGQTFRRSCFTLAIANAPMYGYGFVVAPAAVLNDSKLEVMLIKKAPKWRIILEGWRYLTNSLHKSPLAERYETGVVEVKTPFAPCAAHVDGESLRVGASVRFEIVPASLKVMCPADYVPRGVEAL